MGSNNHDISVVLYCIYRNMMFFMCYNIIAAHIGGIYF